MKLRRIPTLFSEDFRDIAFISRRYTISGSPVQTTTPFGKGVMFDGADYFFDTNTPTYDVDNFSVYIRVKPTTISGDNRCIIHHGQDNTNAKWHFAVYLDGFTTTGRVCMVLGNGSTYGVYCSVNTIDTTKFHDIGITLQGTSLRIYINGVLDTTHGTISTSGYDKNKPLTIGARSLTTSTFDDKFAGIMQTIILTDKILQLEDFEDLYYNRSWIYDAFLVCHYNMSEVNPYDVSENGHNGTGENLISTNIVNSYGGKYGLNFNGSDEFVTIPASTDFDINEYTIAAIIRPDTISGDNRTIIHHGQDNANAKWHFIVYLDGFSVIGRIVVMLGNGSTYSYYYTTGTVNAKELNRIVVTAKGSTLRIYINGELDSSHTISASTGYDTNKPMTIGARSLTSSTYDDKFNGMIDEVRYFNKRLNYIQVLDLDRRMQNGE